MRDRKIFLVLILTIIFAFGIVVWYFFGSKNTPNPSIATPTNPFGNAESRPGSEFVKRFTSSSPETETETERIPASERALVQVWDKPVGGYAFVTREIMVEGTTTPSLSTSTPQKLPKPYKKTVQYLMFVDRITGNIYGYNKESPTPFQITNTTVPGIYDAYIVQNGTKVFMRYLDQESGAIKTTMATIPYFIEGADPHSLTDIKSLQDNISSFAVSGSSNIYSYIVPSYYGSSFYTINQKGVTSVITSPLREWSIVYGGETPYVTNKPSAYLEGSTYSLPKQEYVLGGKTGLISLPNVDGSKVMASMWSSGGLSTFVSSKKTGLAAFELKTIASKCAWLDLSKLLCGIPTTIQTGNEGLPDDWFQGTVAFSDDLYLVDADNFTSSGIYNLSNESNNSFDVIRPKIDDKKTFMAFTNKQGGSLWLVNLSLVIPVQ